MADLREQQNAAGAARGALQAAEQALEGVRNRLRAAEHELLRAERQGRPGLALVRELEQTIRELESQRERALRDVAAARATLADVVERIPAGERPWELVEQLGDHLPFLLFPVRIETRFMRIDGGTELWVRIFPDDIAVHTHEEAMTHDEVESGKTYWRELWAAAQAAEEARAQREKGAWRVLAEAYGGTRAAWIAARTEPDTLDVVNVDDLAFPEFAPDDLKTETWGRSPRSNILPDRFVVMTFVGGRELHRRVGNPVPQPLIMGPDPQALQDEYRQLGGELLVGEDIAWIYDFHRAVDIGMAVRIPLEEPEVSQGFDRIIVLGLRLTSDARQSQETVETLIKNHRHSADGMSLVPQGTPTNNTAAAASGFASTDAGAEESFTLETGDVLFEPTDESREKTDGQRLAEALGIRHEPLQRIRYADQRDIAEAMAMNKALWPGTIGYFLEEMLELDRATVAQTRRFFTEHVTGRGPLPAIRVGTQPYGVLLTSDFSRWKWSRELDDEAFPFLERFYAVMSRAREAWRRLVDSVPRAGGPGDAFQNLLGVLGLHAASVEYYRRRAIGKEHVWNYEIFNAGVTLARRMMAALNAHSQALLEELGFDFQKLPRLFELVFFRRHDIVTDPLVDDIPAEERERLSETRGLRGIYKVPDPADAESALETNYLGWLAHADFEDLKRQRFKDMADTSLPVPRPLLYRMLRGALLQAYYDASMQVYTGLGILQMAARREEVFTNIQADRTVTRWELMDADVSRVVPQLGADSQSMGRFLQSQGLDRSEALDLGEVRQSLAALVGLPTARLERLFAEHVDLCGYRLDAWQTACFHRRLQQQRHPAGTGGAFDARVQGIYIGAFGWLEDVRPDPRAVPADLSSVPAALHDPAQDGELIELAGSGGLVHGPSLNHAVAAAVLRNAYLTHFDADRPETMAVNLSSERVRKALAFLDGIRNGEELGALLGYQFERGLHDRHGDPSLNQFIPLIRQQYPLVADKITEDETGESVDAKEARNVVDGYALVEQVFLKEQPGEQPQQPPEVQHYPYGVAGLPAPESAQAKAIQSEVARMADSFDAVADLALAEGVYQVVQGNFERAGAMIKAFTEGNNPPEPEIVRTPIGGAAVTHRVALQLDTGSTIESPWPGPLSVRARIEPRLNRWLGTLLPAPDRIRYVVALGENAPELQALDALRLQPIDLIYLIGDELADETTELESRIAHFSRRAQGDDALVVRIEFMTPLSASDGVALFELLPLLRALRALVTSCRPLAADDFVLPSEATTDPDEDPKCYDLANLQTRVADAIGALEAALDALLDAIPPDDSEGQPEHALAHAEDLRDALTALADFGLPDAFPRSAFGEADEAKRSLVHQSVLVEQAVQRKLSNAKAFEIEANDVSRSPEERAASYRATASQIFGPSFNLIPLFTLKNPVEMAAAADFRDAPPAVGLIRFHQHNAHLVDEWLAGAARVRDRLGTLEAVGVLSETLAGAEMALRPLQLPFRPTDHWVAVEYPAVDVEDLDDPASFVPEGDLLSVVQWLPQSGFDPAASQGGLLIDEWSETIPGRRQTTGIAVHYNQPGSEPPQVLLLAVTPEVTGRWTWDELVGTLHDTFDRCRERAVEPEQLDGTAYAQLLPAVLSAVSSSPLATISTDLTHHTAIADLGSTPGTP